jgi:hypothetical protein
MMLAAACARGESIRGSHTVRDSAGVEIVESSRPAWGSVGSARISAEPDLTIGAVDGDTAYLFHGILGARRLSDGRFVVANRGTSELRFFDSNGRFSRQVGGEGDGPGEYRFMSLFWTRAGDTVVVADARGLSILDPQGRFVRLIQPGPAGTGRAAQLVGQLDDGTLLGIAFPRSAASPPGQPARNDVAFHLFRADGSHRDELTAVPGAEMWPFEVAGSVMPRRVPFSAYPAWAVVGERIYITGGSEPEVQVWSAAGALDRLVRWSPASRTLTSEHITLYRDHVLRSVTDPSRRQQQERFLGAVRMPAQMPATGEVSAILVGDDGTMWVQAYRLPWQPSSEWLVFSSDGAWLGSVPMRERFSPHQIGRDFVVGSWRDESGVEFVHLYRVTPASGSR